jgi:hypothetical protein
MTRSYPDDAPLMAWDAPQRPTIAGDRFALVRPQDGAPIGVLPDLCFRTLKNDLLEVYLHAIIHGNVARHYTIEWPVEVFGWWPEVRVASVVRLGASAKDALDALEKLELDFKDS